MLADLFVCLHEHVVASLDAYLSILFLFIYSQTLPRLFLVEVFYLLGLHSLSDVTRFLVNIKGEMTMKNYSMKVFVSVAVLGTLAFILMMLQFPLLPSAPFLKLDFSDIPALIGGLLFGPLAVILVELIKNVLLYIVSGSPVGVPVGELANFISGIFYVLPIYYLFHWLRSTKGMVLSTAVGTLLMTGAMALFNYFVLLPFYIKLGGLPANTDVAWLITYAIIPFNLLKGVIVSAVFLLLYSRLKKWIAKNQTIKERRKFEKKRQEMSH